MSSSWHTQAACRKTWVDPDWFFPSEGTGGRDYGDNGIRAKLVCSTCPVLTNCWQENFHAGIGIIAGTDERERARLAKAGSTSAPTPPAPSEPGTGLQVALYAFLHGGLTIEQAAREAEVSARKLLRLIRERLASIPVGRREIPAPVDTAEMIARRLHRTGYRPDEIAAQMGLSLRSIQRYLKPVA